nr:response regulator transcription factor [Pseudonocardia acaciae]
MRHVHEPKPLVLIAEDDAAIATLVRLYLEREGYRVEVYTDGEETLAAVARLRPTALVLDIGLPTLDGLRVCQRMRAERDWTPVLFITARDDEVDRILGLELGGDDYLTKPFSPRELMARLRAVLRRGDPERAGAELVAGSIRLDPNRRQVWAGQRAVELTATEFDLLAHLMRRPGWVFERGALLADVWGYPDVSSRTVDVHIAQLRSKLGAASPIRTVRGVGYAVDDT